MRTHQILYKANLPYPGWLFECSFWQIIRQYTSHNITRRISFACLTNQSTYGKREGPETLPPSLSRFLPLSFSLCQTCTLAAPSVSFICFKSSLVLSLFHSFYNSNMYSHSYVCCSLLILLCCINMCSLPFYLFHFFVNYTLTVHTLKCAPTSFARCVSIRFFLKGTVSIVNGMVSFVNGTIRFLHGTVRFVLEVS